MAALSADTPDKVVVLPLVEEALSWDLNSPDLPSVTSALNMARQFTTYGRLIAEDLRAQCRSVPADSDFHLRARATLSEADARLNLKPLAPSTTPRSAAHRAQNLARLVQALNRASAQASPSGHPRSSPQR
ncbi:DUF6415 family natural product biosynthesis protein [Streptomyces sp. BH105]|uniref:DUF6415 family natural product biosynthesis protein n=1 Tax=Streptomyces sp. BH105 TaxID=3410408 RepID=UPI003CEB0D8C